jgi:SAM-dependent methyltransferase
MNASIGWRNRSACSRVRSRYFTNPASGSPAYEDGDSDTKWDGRCPFAVARAPYGGRSHARGNDSIAREKVAEAGLEDAVDCRLGDVRRLPYPDDTFDATCCLGGVMSHVVDAERRRQATAELRRVTRPGGPVFVAVIGRLGAVRYGLKNSPEADMGPADWRVLEHVLDTGDYTADAVERFAASLRDDRTAADVSEHFVTVARA